MLHFLILKHFVLKNNINEKSVPNLLQHMTFRHYKPSVLCDNETVNWYPNEIKFKMHDQRKNCNTDTTNQ